MKSQGVNELSSFVFLCVQQKLFIGSGRTFAAQCLTKISWLPVSLPLRSSSFKLTLFPCVTWPSPWSLLLNMTLSLTQIFSTNLDRVINLKTDFALQNINALVQVRKIWQGSVIVQAEEILQYLVTSVCYQQNSWSLCFTTIKLFNTMKLLFRPTKAVCSNY